MPIVRPRLAHLALACTIATTLIACGDSSEVVGQAGALTVSAREVQAIVAALPAQTRAVVEQDKGALERVVRAELVRRAILQEARDARLDADAKVQAELERVRDDALVRLWIARKAEVSSDYPSEEDLRVAFESNRGALVSPAEYQVAQIFISAPNGIGADRLAVAMRKAADVGSRIPGGDFAALAREYSDHADTASRGGDVGMLPANRMLPEIVAAVRDLEVGAAVGPVKTSQGLHYVKLLERRNGTALTLEQVQSQLVTALRARRAQELEQGYLAQLDSRLGVTIDQIALAAAGDASKTEKR
jgi:peptidylprolyl isomerase